MPYFPQSDALVLPAPVLSYRNILGRNGGFEVWQRGAGGAANIVVPTNGCYTSDGWWAFHNGAAGQFQVNQSIISSEVQGSRYCAIAIRPNGTTAATLSSLEFPLDIDEIIRARNSVVTLSFTCWTGTTWSPAGGVLSCAVFTGTGAVSKCAGFGYTSQVSVISQNIVPTATPTRFQMTSPAVLPLNATQACVMLYWQPVGTAGNDDWFTIDDVQLEVGSVATPFERRPFESELLACQRHFFKTFAYNLAPVSAVAGSDRDNAFSHMQVVGASASSNGQYHQFPVRMRAAPSVLGFNPQSVSGNYLRNLNTSSDCTGLIFAPAERGVNLIYTAAAASGVGQWLAVHITADAGI